MKIGNAVSSFETCLWLCTCTASGHSNFSRFWSKEGGFVSVCLKLHEDYRIGITTGVRGEPVQILEDSYSSEEACEHAIFLKRIKRLLNEYSGD